MAENQELEALDHLVSSPGWTLFQQMVAKDWGTTEGGGAQFLKGITDVMKAESPESNAQLRQIIVAQREIHKLMQAVPNRIKALQHSNDASAGVFVGSRRGAL